MLRSLVSIAVAGLALTPLVADARSSATVMQGEVARWDAHEADSCGIFGKRYPAVEGVCYYPVDLATEPGLHEIALYTPAGEQHLGWLSVKNVNFPTIDLELDSDRLIDLDGELLEQHQRNRAELREHVFGIEAREPEFTLPLGQPTEQMPASEDDFGSLRIFNNSDAESRHSGRDYPVAAGTTIRSPADGTVLLAADHLLTGSAVYVDHGDGLVSMFFHMSELAVATGDEVARGDALGAVGNSGRSTGPHLHFGVRWLEQRVDPALLLDSPDQFATVGPDGGSRGTAGRDEPREDSDPDS